MSKQRISPATLRWLLEMEHEEVAKLAMNSIEADIDFRDYAEYVHKESTAWANAFRSSSAQTK